MTKPDNVLIDIDELELVIEKLVDGGEGLARHDGMPVFVPRSAPGDRVRARVTQRRPHYGRAEIVEILEPGTGRREPPCTYFERCGGCDLQHLEDTLQTELKVKAARETLRRLGEIELSGEQSVVTSEAWGYRMRTQLHMELAGERPTIGYFARRSRDLVGIDQCPVLVPELENILPSLPRQLTGKSLRRLDLVAAGGQISAAPPSEDLPGGEITVESGGFVYGLDARVFFQGHRGLLERLTEAVVGPKEGVMAFDLYAGVGLFSLPLARRYERVTAVEGDRVAARYARKNARRNKVDRLEIVAKSVEGWIANLPQGADRIVVDPPRIGLTAGVRMRLLDREPKHITYVSCHAAALARDLRVLRHVYRVEELVYLDLFPQTGHLEIVAQLSRASL